MPVSTSFSSDNDTRCHSQQALRRSSSREQASNVDEEARNVTDMQELDATRSARYDPSNWPLAASPDISDEDSSSNGVRKRMLQHEPAEMEDERAVYPEHASRKVEQRDSRLSRQAFPDEHDVSDLEDDDSLDEIEAPSPPRFSPGRAHQSLPDLRRESRRSLASPPHQAHSEVSPIREERVPTPAAVREHPEDHASDFGIPEGSRGAYVSTNGHAMDDEDEEYESRDAPTPIPFASSSSSPVLRQDEMQGMAAPSPTAAVENPIHTTPPMVNGSTFRNSTSKSSMTSPLHRRASTRSRSSFINTNNSKSHVRYSWQSIQEDEPNKPRIHIIKLVSNTATASAGFPTGEAFGFSISPGGRKIAAYNSARLYVLQTNALPVGISQDYALKRRPLAVELNDEGNTMAILADDHTVNVYDIGLHLKRVRTIKLDFPTNCIALAPTGGLLAAAYEGGVEIFSLAASALPTDRRAVRSVKMDRLSFSEDGSTLLGTTTRINVSSTVVVNVPVFPSAPGNVPTHEELKEAWCSELLHPENVRNSSHATFMRENRKTCNERVFAWNGLEDTFGILNVTDMQYGNIDFPVVITPPLSTCGGLGAAIHSCPSIDEHGDTVAMVVNDRTIRLYIVPHKNDEGVTSLEAHSIDHELDEGYGCPFSEARWVYSPSNLPPPTDHHRPVKGRLIVTSPGGVVDSGISEESVEDIEGGRIIMFDFDPQFAGQPGQTFSLLLGKSPPQLLEEEQTDLAEQVALVRRRTVNQSKGKGLSTRPAALGRAATTNGQRGAPRPAAPAVAPVTTAQRNRMSMLSIGSMQSEAARSLPDLMENGEQADVFEEPYVQGAPRSQASLQRAASNVQRHRFQTLEERQRERISVDSHGDFLPLPEYSEEPNAPLPSRYRALAGLDQPAVFNPKKPAVIVNNGSSTSPGASSSSATITPQTAPPDIGENFSADLAFQAANARIVAEQQAATESTPPVPTVPAHLRNSSVQHSPVSTPTSIPPRPDVFNDYASGNRNSYRTSITPSISSANGTAMFTAVQQPQRNVPYDPPGRQGTFDSVASMPRGLQRAYSNVVSPIGSGPPPSLIGDWRNVSPVVGNTPPASYAGSVRSGGREPSVMNGSMQEEEAWDTISPVPSNTGSSPYGQQQRHPYRYSTSLLNPPGHRVPSSSSHGGSLGDSSPPPSSNGQRIPPHIQAMRNVAAANASASLFPPNQPRDHVPLRHNTVKASSVAHPVTAWHPPAAASTPNITRTSGSMRGHSRRSSSLAGKSAFASTAKAKRLGFFKKKQRHDPYGPSASNGGREGGSIFETKSMMTWGRRGDAKCVVM